MKNFVITANTKYSEIVNMLSGLDAFSYNNVPVKKLATGEYLIGDEVNIIVSADDVFKYIYAGVVVDDLTLDGNNFIKTNNEELFEEMLKTVMRYEVYQYVMPAKDGLDMVIDILDKHQMFSECVSIS